MGKVFIFDFHSYWKFLVRESVYFCGFYSVLAKCLKVEEQACYKKSRSMDLNCNELN